MSPIRLRVGEYLALAAAHGHHTHEAQATAAGLGFGSIWRARNGDPVGGKVINALLTTYGVEFDSLFTTTKAATSATTPTKAIA